MIRAIHVWKLRAVTLLAILGLTMAGVIAGAGSAMADTSGYPYANAVNCSSTHGPYSWCIGGDDISPYGYAYATAPTTWHGGSSRR
jgi:hypothetical protein